ncbi:MAG: aminotransferase class III-fold pyridoxal phosphate-dependent enzyme, partial [Desulfobulbaceae bacterium]|nr:aminotransferase class III-fold pyridoxal phosphate-dependent enzyme [Desulfobulbaceae bacterium]
PDLTALGKVIGGGFPIGALAGKKDVMDVMNPLQDKLLFPHSGTFSANPVTMTAGRTAMELYGQEEVACLNRLGDLARQHIKEAIDLADIRACVSGAGSMFRVHLKDDIPAHYRDAYMGPEETRQLAVLLDHLFENGIMVINTCSGALSTPMTEKEIDVLGEVMLDGFRKLKKSENTL